jgi:hypothetical protein
VQRLTTGSNKAEPAVDDSTLGPFRDPAFTVLWLATVVSNVGVWMQNAAASWLMTGLTSNPFLVSLVQVATSVPMFLFALQAGPCCIPCSPRLGDRIWRNLYDINERQETHLKDPLS